MKKFEGFDNARVIGDFETLPKGNYVCKVMGVATKESKRGGEYLELSFDIAEGDYKGFYERDYKNNSNEDKKWRGTYFITIPDDNSPEWAANKLKTIVNAFEDSNKKYHWDWDETKWKGLIFGGKFRVEEYEKQDGSIGSVVRMAGTCPADKIRNGEAKEMKDKLLDNKPNGGSNDGFVDIPDATDEDLPF